MTGYVYILQCADGSYYTGSTKDIEARLWQHQNGEGADHTRKRLPVKLVFVEECERIDDAFAREKQIQGWSRKKKEALIQGDFNQLHSLSVCQNASRASGVDHADASLRLRSGNAEAGSCLSGVEGSGVESSEDKGALLNENAKHGSSLRLRSGNAEAGSCLSEVEGSEVEGSEVEGSEDKGALLNENARHGSSLRLRSGNAAQSADQDDKE